MRAAAGLEWACVGVREKSVRMNGAIQKKRSCPGPLLFSWQSEPLSSVVSSSVSFADPHPPHPTFIPPRQVFSGVRLYGPSGYSPSGLHITR